MNNKNWKIIVTLINTVLITEVLSRSGLVIEEVPPSLPPPPPTPTVFKMQQCRDGCLDKVTDIQRWYIFY